MNRATLSPVEPTPAPGAIRWTLRRHPGGSDKFGPCEVCGAYASDIYHQSATVAYLDSEERGMCWTYYGAPPSKWGHASCLLALRGPTDDELCQQAALAEGRVS